jgi:phosphate transport system protein
MVSLNPHTVKAFDEDLQGIRALVAEMGGLVEQAVFRATKALIDCDEATAREVVRDDAQIDRLSQEVERRCLCLIALRAPMADDLREVLAGFKIATVVERMGDCARSIAEQVPRVRGLTRASLRNVLRRMSAEAQEAVQHALDIFVRQDGDLGQRPVSVQERLASLHDELLRDLLDTMTEVPSAIGSSTSMLMASQKLVRLAEHSANIVRISSSATRREAILQPLQPLQPLQRQD